MATDASPVMPACWTQLNSSRLHKRQCDDEIRSIKKDCSESHNKQHIAECQESFDLLVDRMSMRYTTQNSEWFTDRKAFVQELEGLFADVRKRKRGLDSIEARIESEKEAWYRLMLRRHPDFLALAGPRQGELRRKLDDPDLTRQNLIDMAWQGVGKPDNWESDVDSFAEKVAAVGDDSAALKRLYLEEIFTEGTRAGAEKYIEEFTQSENMTLEDVINKMVGDIRQSRSSQPQRDIHQKRLDELRRAKAAFEKDKAEAKNRARNAPVAGEDLYELPSCSFCQSAVDTTKVLSCTVCQVTTQVGGAKRLTLYCSDKCYEQGHAEHVKKEHNCQAGDECWQLLEEDTDMEGSESQAVTCKACLAAKKMTLYCSSKCAAKNETKHVKDGHSLGEDSKDTTIPLAQVVSGTLERENPRMVFSAL